MHERSSFITLTHSDETLPWNGNLDVKLWQVFAAKLRRKMGKFRFYHCGEYGEKTNRPHYHALLFGIDFRHDRTLFRVTSDGHHLYESETLNECWDNQGHALIGEVTSESAGYVAGYVTKKKRGELGRWTYRTVDPLTAEVEELKPPYSTMSRNPGIGRSWIERYGADVYANDSVVTNGRPATPPRFYDSWLEESDPERLEMLKAERAKKAARQWKDQTPDRLRTREKVANYRALQIRRDPNKR